MDDLLTHETFSRNMKTKFQVQIDETNYVDLELAQASELKVYPNQEEFSIVFVGPGEIFLGQGVRSFKHDQMGHFELFIVPIAQDEQGFHYEAVFNRVKSATPTSAS